MTRIAREDWNLNQPTHRKLGDSWVLNRQPDGACVFLDQSGKCQIHTRFGMEAKPLACQVFPYTFRKEGDSIRVGLRFDCPSVARSEGASLKSQTREIHQLARKAQDEMPTWYGHVRLRADVDNLQEGSQRALRVVDRIMCEGDPADSTPSERIRNTAFVVSMLLRAKLGTIDEDDFAAFVELVAESASSATEEMSAGPATVRARRLLRQLVFAHVELTPFGKTESRGLSRMRLIGQQLTQGRRFRIGRGSLPEISTLDEKTVTFIQVETVKPARGEEATTVGTLISRWVRGRIACGSCYGGGYYGWGICEGLGAMMLGIVVASWRARWLAATADRDRLCAADVVGGIGFVDRVAGRVPSLRTRAELMRMKYLMEEWRMQELLTSYPLVEE